MIEHGLPSGGLFSRRPPSQKSGQARPLCFGGAYERRERFRENSESQRAFYTLNLAVFTAMLGMGIVIPFLPIYAKSLGAPGTTIGVSFVRFPLAQMLLMPAIGRLSV